MREHLGCGLPPRLILEIDVRERLSIVVTHDESGVLFLDGPRSRKTTWRHLCRDQNAEPKRSLGRSPPEASGCALHLLLDPAQHRGGQQHRF
jgi:hypothetical protein